MKPDRREIGVMTAIRIRGTTPQRSRIIDTDNGGYTVEWSDIPVVPADAPNIEKVPRPRTTSANQPPYYY